MKSASSPEPLLMNVQTVYKASLGKWRVKYLLKKIFGVMKPTYLSQGPLGSYQLSTKLGKMHSFQGEKIHVAKLQKYTDDIVSIIFLNRISGLIWGKPDTKLSWEQRMVKKSAPVF